MSRIFDSYLRAKDASFRQGAARFAMQQQMEQLGRDRQLRNVLSQSYQAPTPAYEMEGPARPGETLPTMPAQAGGFDYGGAVNALAASGLGPEALQLQGQADARTAPYKLEAYKHQLKQQAKGDALKQFQSMMGGGGPQVGQKFKMTPRGPELEIDPSVQQDAEIKRLEFMDKFGFDPSTGRRAAPNIAEPSQEPSLPPATQRSIRTLQEEEGIKGGQKRINELRSSRNSRNAFFKKAHKFKKLIESSEMSTGAGRSFLQFVPGVYTEQGALSEEFNAFAETAARAALKASGEIRPTDADVKGMKEAMFGVGRDEQVNINLLQDSIEQMEADAYELADFTGEPVEIPDQNDKQTKQTPRTSSTDENKAALKWATENPNDPRAIKILKKLGVK